MGLARMFFPRAQLWLSTSLVTGSISETQKQQPLRDS